MNDKILEFIGSNRFYSPIIIIIGAIIIYNIISLVLSKAVVKGHSDLDAKRRKTIILLINNIIKYVIIIIAAVMVLNVFEIDTTSVVTGLGIAGVVVGLALQDALKDIIGGINIILENYFVLGDTVKYNDFMGTVIEFGLKSTKIKSANGEVLIIANRSIDKIINLSQKQAIINFDVPTAASCDALKVKKVLEGIVEKVKKLDNVEADGCEYIGVEKLESNQITYSFRIKCKQDSQFALRRMILEMIKEAYDKADLKFS